VYGFRRTITGKITTRLDKVERGLLRTLAEQLLEIVEPPEAKPADPLAVELGLEDLEASLNLPLEDDRDPVLDRLLPAAYDDDQAAQEFRQFSEMGLRRGKTEALKRMIATLPTDTDKVVLTADDAQAWLTALNDIRLALSVRLGIESDADIQRLSALPDDDPEAGLYHVYEFLTYVLETLVQAMPN
jgi:hypothetical protein